MIIVDGRYAATFRFRDAPRDDSRSFIGHLWSRHHDDRVLIVSGDREQEVRYLAQHCGITEVHAGQSPEDKVAITRAETARGPTLFIGDGINDAPALATATVGVAFGHQSEITAEAAGVIIMDTSLKRVDEFFHIGPADAANRPAERRRRHGLERRWNAAGLRRPSGPGHGRCIPGGHRLGRRP
jgi:P-type E1-E2 ATPase